MKVKIHPWRMVWRYLVSLLGIYIFIFLVCMGMFIDFSTGTFIPWDFRQPLLIVAIFVTSFITFIICLVNSYYIIENDHFVSKRMTKVYEYSYSNIIYINKEKSLKKKKVIFYSKVGKMQYLLADKDNILYETLIKKCKNLQSEEEFFRLHPEER